MHACGFLSSSLQQTHPAFPLDPASARAPRWMDTLGGSWPCPSPTNPPQHFHLNLITIKALLRSTAPLHAGQFSVRTRLSHIQTEEFSTLFVVLFNSGTLLRYIQLAATYKSCEKNATLFSCFICFVCLLWSCVLCYVLFIHHCKPNLLLSFHAAWKKRK